MVIGLTARDDVLPRRRPDSIHLAAIGVAALVALVAVGLRAYQLDRIRTWLDPWSDPLGTGFHTIQGLLALGLGGILGAGLGESRLAGGLFLPNASNDYIFAIIGEEFGLIGGGRRDRPVRRSGLLWHPRLARGARHVRGAAGGRASPPGCASRPSSTSASSSRSSR